MAGSARRGGTWRGGARRGGTWRVAHGKVADGMGKKRILQSIVDMAMAILLPLLMARSLIGEAAHEWMGVAMLCLFLLHHALNHRWYGALFHGRYHAARVLNTAVNFLLLADMFLMGISGIMLSAHVFSFLHLSKGASVARLIHLPCAFWGFLLMSFHIGLHWQTVWSRMLGLLHREAGKRFLLLMRVLVLLISAYGIYAFFKRHFPDYLFLKSQFLFVDNREPLAFYLLDMVAIMVLFATLGYGCMRLLVKQEKRKQEKRKQEKGKQGEDSR